MDPASFIDEFRAEAGEHLGMMEEQLLRLEQDPRAMHLVRDIFRSAHTIKGGAAMLGISDVLELAHVVEDVLARLRDEHQAISEATANLIFEAIDVLRDGVTHSLPHQPHADPRRARLIAALGEHDSREMPAPIASSDGLRALVVDKSATVRKLSTILLVDAGFVVDAVTNGEQALAEARGGAYDLLVTAVETDRISGFDLTEALRRLPATRDLRIILTTTNENEEHRQRAKALNVQAYLPKGSLGDRRLAEVATRLMATPPAAVPRPGAAHILLVDDSRLLQAMTLAQLKQLEYTAEPVDNGRLAIVALTRRHYDLVLMDCQMPEMDGLETSREIRRQEQGGRHVPIIAMTGGTDEDDRARCLAAGMDDFLIKPVATDALAARLAFWTRPRPALRAVVDFEALDAMRALRQPDQPDPVSSLIYHFLAETAERFTDCQEAIQLRDSARLGAACHALRGSSGTFGATGLLSLITQLEQCATPQGIDEAAPILAAVRHEFELVAQALRAVA